MLFYVPFTKCHYLNAHWTLERKKEKKKYLKVKTRFPIDSLIVLRKNNFKKTTLSQCWRKTSSKVTFRKIISFLIPNAFNTNILGLTFTTFEVLSFQSWNCRVVDFHKYCKLYFLQFHCMEMQVALICLDHNQQTIYRLHCCHLHFDHNWCRAFLQIVWRLSFKGHFCFAKDLRLWTCELF